MRKVVIHLTTVLLLIGLLAGCHKKYAPKPRGYYRIDFPEKNYQTFSNSFPYGFEYPVYAKIIPDTASFAEPYWIDIYIPKNNARFHLSYKKVNGQLAKLTEESRELAYKHTIKASSIEEKLFVNPNDKVYGTVYNIKGNAASPMQFYMTDSTEHFLRGSFYISEIPNYDSLLPVIQFLETDITHLVETLHWN